MDVVCFYTGDLPTTALPSTPRELSSALAKAKGYRLFKAFDPSVAVFASATPSMCCFLSHSFRPLYGRFLSLFPYLSSEWMSCDSALGTSFHLARARAL